MKVTFTMADPEPKKHSVQFGFETLESIDGASGETLEKDTELHKETLTALKRASFYIPRPIGEKAKRIRVTIEEL